jgi:predicted enzyme related to lactoylglutathione lyase
MVDYRLELVFVPVSDVDAAKEFYGTTLGWPVDNDAAVSDDMRFIQVTPPGSACSIAFGLGLSSMEAGSLRALQAVVSDIEVAHRDLAGRGIDVTDVEDLPWGRFVHFSDPDGNTWAIQQLVPRT